MIDTRRVPDHISATGIHWQVSQATSLMNIRFVMSDRKGNAHQGACVKWAGCFGDAIDHM